MHITIRYSKLQQVHDTSQEKEDHDDEEDDEEETPKTLHTLISKFTHINSKEINTVAYQSLSNEPIISPK